MILYKISTSEVNVRKQHILLLEKIIGDEIITFDLMCGTWNINVHSLGGNLHKEFALKWTKGFAWSWTNKHNFYHSSSFLAQIALHSLVMKEKQNNCEPNTLQININKVFEFRGTSIILLFPQPQENANIYPFFTVDTNRNKN